MNILLQPSAPSAVASRWPAPEIQRLILHDVSWQSYVAIGDALPNRPGLRMTYDRGSLEFMTTSPEHEIYKKRLGRLIETLVRLRSSAEGQEGLAAFLEKRAPEWTR